MYIDKEEFQEAVEQSQQPVNVVVNKQEEMAESDSEPSCDNCSQNEIKSNFKDILD